MSSYPVRVLSLLGSSVLFAGLVVGGGACGEDAGATSNTDAADGAPSNGATTTPDGGSEGEAPDSSSSGDAAGGPTLLGWQLTTTNIGVAGVGLSCDGLPLYGGPSKPPAGTVISGRRIESALDLSAGDVVIEKSCVRPTSVGMGLPVITTTNNNACNKDECAPTPATVTIRDSDIDGTKLAVDKAAFATGFLGVANIQRTYVHHLGSGIGLMNTGDSLNAVIENNYVTDLLGFGDPATTGNHSDAFTIRDFDISAKPQRQLLVRNNRFDCDSINATGAFFIQTYSGNIANARIEGNLLEGGGYQLALEAQRSNTYGNMQATNNRFSGTGYGAAYVTGGPGWTTWQDNFLANPSAPDYKGRAIAKP